MKIVIFKVINFNNRVKDINYKFHLLKYRPKMCSKGIGKNNTDYGNNNNIIIANYYY
jgi:hypothetical protein